MLSSVLLKSLRDQRRSMIWWGIGLVALVVFTVLFYPSFKDSPEFNDLLGDSDSITRVFAGDVADLTSPEGFLNSQLMFLMVPLLLIVFAIWLGTGAIAGEERRGTLDVLLANPVTRSRVLLEKLAALVVATLVLAFLMWLGTTIAAAAIGMDVSFSRLAEAMLSAWLLGVLFGALALAIGSATGKISVSVGLAGAVAVVSYFLNALAPVVDAVEPLRNLSPFHYYIGADPLTNGIDLAHAAVLVGLTLALVVVATVTFERRDLGV